MQRQPTFEDYAWQIYCAQFESGFRVSHPTPEAQLHAEIAEYWAGRREALHGWSDPLGQRLREFFGEKPFTLEDVARVAWEAARWTVEELKREELIRRE